MEITLTQNEMENQSKHPLLLIAPSKLNDSVSIIYNLRLCCLADKNLEAEALCAVLCWAGCISEIPSSHVLFIYV